MVFYTKEVSTDAVLIIEGTCPRAKIDVLRVQFFKDIYSQREEDIAFEIPPLDVSLVQTGEPGKELFALEDGLHRLLAQKEMKRKKIKVRIRTETSISDTELNTYDVKKHLLIKSCESNARHGIPLSHEEKKAAVERLNQYGCSRAEIVATGIASKATIYRWLESEIKERKNNAINERVNKKEHVKTLFFQGASLKKIVDETGMPRTTVRRMIKEVAKSNEREQAERAGSIAENNGQLYMWMTVDESASISGSKAIGAQNADELHEPRIMPDDVMISETAKKEINEIYDKIRALAVNDAADHEIKTIILPLLAQKFPGVAGIIRDGGYAMEMEALQHDLKATKEELYLQRKELLNKEELLQHYKEQLKKRTENCNYRCEFTTDRLRQEFEKYVNFMVSHISEHLAAIPQLTENERDTLKKLTVNSVFTLLSLLEWGDDNGLTSMHTKEKFERFKDSICSIDIANSSISNRILMLEKIYHKIPSIPRSYC